MIHCMGCHGEQGDGFKDQVPSMRGTLARLATLPEGRSILLRVPGVSQFSLDAVLTAEVLNWQPLRGLGSGRLAADPPPHGERGRHRRLRRHQRGLLLHALRRDRGQGSPFGKRIAHGYFVLSAAAGLFVWPAPGPVLANYGLDTLRFVKPVGIGDTIQARLTCKRKTDRPTRPGQAPQGVVAWDVQVTNQAGELVSSYDILTLVAKPG